MFKRTTDQIWSCFLCLLKISPPVKGNIMIRGKILGLGVAFLLLFSCSAVAYAADSTTQTSSGATNIDLKSYYVTTGEVLADGSYAKASAISMKAVLNTLPNIGTVTMQISSPNKDLKDIYLANKTNSTQEQQDRANVWFSYLRSPGAVTLMLIGKNGYSNAFTQKLDIVYDLSSSSEVTISPIEDQKYTGSAIHPVPVVKTVDGLELVAGQDYIYSYRNNINVGTACVDIFPKSGGRCMNAIKVDFKIVNPNAESTNPESGDDSADTGDGDSADTDDGTSADAGDDDADDSGADDGDDDADDSGADDEYYGAEDDDDDDEADAAQYQYTITYNLSGGNNGANPAGYNKGASFKFKDASKTGYTFKGWYLDKNYKKKITAITKSDTGNKTLYAKWAVKSYKISYVLNGGKNNNSNPSSYTYGKKNITLKNPTRSNCTFKGWYSDKNFKNQVKQITKTDTGKKTLYAKWSKKSYKITYNLNGGTNASGNPSSYTYGSEVKLKSPVRTGYSFKGWYPDKKFLKSKVTKISKKDSGNKTFYAKWEKKSYKITYHLNGGKNASGNPKTYKYGSAVTLKSPSRSGYNFKGWYSDSKFLNAKVTKITKTDSGDKALYAKWEGKSYKITYHLNGGTNNAANPASYKYGSEVSLKSPSRSGYTFKGWYSNKGLSNKVTKISKKDSGNKNLYAKWAKNKKKK